MNNPALAGVAHPVGVGSLYRKLVRSIPGWGKWLGCEDPRSQSVWEATISQKTEIKKA